MLSTHFMLKSVPVRRHRNLMEILWHDHHPVGRESQEWAYFFSGSKRYLAQNSYGPTPSVLLLMISPTGFLLSFARQISFTVQDYMPITELTPEHMCIKNHWSRLCSGVNLDLLDSRVHPHFPPQNHFTGTTLTNVTQTKGTVLIALQFVLVRKVHWCQKYTALELLI